MTITVLVPVYRAGRFVAQTLQSALGQSYRDIRVHVQVDPSDADGSGAPEDSLQAIAPFRSDPRLRVSCNRTRLGWDGNIRKMLQAIDTRFYAVLPHDDFWHPDYLQVLHAELAASADASVAYCDQVSIGEGEPARKGVSLPRNGTLRAQLWAFLLAGAEALPWRGVVRSDVLTRIGGFPVDGHRGYAVECEFALSLLLAGTAIHVPRAMFHKRVSAADPDSASRQRIDAAAPGELRRAWVRHAGRMQALLADGMRRPHEDGDRSDALLSAALTAAMLRRHQLSLGATLEVAQLAAAHNRLRELAATGQDGGAAVVSRLQLVLSRHYGAAGDAQRGDELATLAVDADREHHEASLHLARRLRARGRLSEALDCVSQLERSAPGMVGVAALRRQLLDAAAAA